MLLIMTDDAGYGVSGTFGGVIPTPALAGAAESCFGRPRFTSGCSEMRWRVTLPAGMESDCAD
jgi:hypothetical protein